MEQIVFTLPGNKVLADSIINNRKAEKGNFDFRRFPDGESYIRVLSDVEGKEAIIVCTFFQPDDKLLPLLFLSKVLKELKAARVTLIAPYLAYMRQDKQFNPGEAVTSAYFASVISSFADRLITIDPHLHRRNSLNEIYSIPCDVLHSEKLIAEWIGNHVSEPLIIGPDSESEQWVSEVAERIGAPYLILSKIRKGDKQVEISVPELDSFRKHTPVLIDDIISTGRTMIETVKQLRSAKMKGPVCIAVHAIFVMNAYKDLMNAGAEQVITTNTIQHPSNGIDMSDLLANALA